MTPKDFDRLSDYIDDRLSPAEKAALEARLAKDSDLRTALIELRLTVRALRDLPPVKVPRSFTLTPAQVGLGERRRPMFPMLRLAAAMSALALFFTVAGDIALTSGMLPGSPAAESEMMAMTAPQDETQAAPPADDTRQAEMAVSDAAPAAEQTRTAAEAEVEAFEGTAQSVIASGGGDIGASGLDTPESAMLPPRATPAPDVTDKSSPTPTDTLDAPAMLPLAAATEAAADPAAGEAEMLYAEPDIAPRPGLPPLRVLQAALAMLTVMLGLGAWFTRRSA